MAHDTVLILIDAQINMFDENFALHNREKILTNLQSLLARARAASAPVIFVQNNGGEGDPDQPGTQGWNIHPALILEAGDGIVQKTTPDSFHNTDLQTMLAERNARRLVIAGMQTEMCVEATCRRAQELGYAVTLAGDAHSTFDGSKQTAAEIIAATNAELGRIVNVVSTADIKFA